MTPEQNVEEEQAGRSPFRFGAYIIKVVEPGTVIEDEDGEKATVERGTAVTNGPNLYMVQEDYDGCLARFQDRDA